MLKLKNNPLFSFKNLKITLAFKFLILFSTGLYVLSLPYYYFKFNLVDGVNIFGYASPSWVLMFEVIFCISLSIICLTWAIITFMKFRSLIKNEIT